MSRIVYGVNPVTELLRGGRERVTDLLLAAGRKPNRLKDIMALARGSGVKIRRVPTADLTRLTGTPDHQGVAVKVGDFAYADLEAILDLPEPSLIVVLDGIQDPHNLGAIGRTTLAVGGQGLIIPKDRAVGVTPTAEKAAAGALARLPVARVVNLNQAVVKLRESGYWILGSAPTAGTGLYDLPDLPRPLAVIIGAEGRGIGRALAEKCDWLTSVPLAQETESLNASVAAGVILFELKRRWAAAG